MKKDFYVERINMKINLTQIKVRPSLLEEEKVLDVQKTIADLIWRECGKEDIAKANFALKLFNAPGEIEITDTEKQYIEAILINAKYWLADAIEKEVNK